MTIGENIRKIRRSRGLTQGTLAELLHITPQAVSRWETNLTTPDLHSLIGLARIFDCTADEVLGLNHIKKEDRIEHYSSLAQKASLHGDADSVLRAWRDALAEFPNDYTVMYNLAHSLNFYADRWQYEKRRPETCTAMMREARELYEYILDHCSDENLLATTERSMYDLLVRAGEYDAAENYLRRMPDLWQSRQIAALDHPKNRREACVTLAADAVHLLKCALDHMIDDPASEEEGGFSTDERAEIAAKLESMHFLFADDLSAPFPNELPSPSKTYAVVQQEET